MRMAASGLTSAEKKELAELRRKNRLLEQDNEILRRAAAISRGRTFSLNRVPAGPRARRRRNGRRGGLLAARRVKAGAITSGKEGQNRFGKSGTRSC